MRVGCLVTPLARFLGVWKGARSPRRNTREEEAEAGQRAVEDLLIRLDSDEPSVKTSASGQKETD